MVSAGYGGNRTLWNFDKHHQYIGMRGGGGVGYGMSAAVGAAMAHKPHGRFCVNFQPDGLWACQRLVTCWLFATTTKYPAVDVVRESADHAVEHCLLHLDDYDRAGAFQEPREKAEWQKWLQDIGRQIQSQKRGGQ